MPNIDDFNKDMQSILQAYRLNDRSGLEQLYLENYTADAIERIRREKGNPYYNPTPKEIQDKIPFFNGVRWNVLSGDITDTGIDRIFNGIRYKYKDLLSNSDVANKLSTIETFLRNNRNIESDKLDPYTVELHKPYSYKSEGDTAGSTEERLINSINQAKQKRHTKQQKAFDDLLAIFSDESIPDTYESTHQDLPIWTEYPSLSKLPSYVPMINTEGEHTDAANKTDAMFTMLDNEKKAREIRELDPYEWGNRIESMILQDPEYQKKARLL